MCLQALSKSSKAFTQTKHMCVLSCSCMLTHLRRKAWRVLLLSYKLHLKTSIASICHSEAAEKEERVSLVHSNEGASWSKSSATLKVWLWHWSNEQATQQRCFQLGSFERSRPGRSMQALPDLMDLPAAWRRMPGLVNENCTMSKRQWHASPTTKHALHDG